MFNSRNSAARAALASIAVICTLIFHGCGKDSPTAPRTTNTPAPQGTITVSATALDFGTVCQNVTKKLSFTIEAPASNEKTVTGSVSFSKKDYSITKGEGAYALAPGQTHTVEVSYKPTTLGSNAGVLSTGVSGKSVTIKGFGSAYPFYYANPTSKTQYVADTNYSPFVSGVNGTIPSTGVSFSDPSWNGCNSSWVFDGNPITESWIEFEFTVPSGTSKVLLDIGMDASNSCAQLLMEVDGAETMKTNFNSSCTTRSYRLNCTAGKRKIRFGTDQQGITCFSDIAVNWIRFTFEGACVPEDQLVY